MISKQNKDLIWILIYTKPQHEKRASENLRKQGFNTFLPLISPANKNGNSAQPVPVFPRYLFVQINLALGNWSTIQSSYGVNKIVMFSEKLTSIPEQIIESIQNKLDKTGVFKEMVSFVDYEKGDAVSIKNGRFEGIDAVFLSKKSKDRVSLLLKLLNTSVLADLDESSIGKKEVTKRFKF